MDDSPLEYGEMARMLSRAVEERRLLCQRIALLEGEKAALMAIVRELQSDLASAKRYIEDAEPVPG